MGDVLRDVNKHITSPILNKVNDKQKGLRRKMAGIIDVKDDEPKKSGNVFENHSDDSAKIDKDSFSLESLRHWDVTMPPAKKNKRLGYMIPSVKSMMNKGTVFNKKRRITIEWYKKITPAQAVKNIEQDRRVFQKLYKRASTVDVEDQNLLSPLGDDDFILFRIFKAAKRGGILDWGDDDSQSTVSRQLPNGTLEKRTLTTYNVKDYGDGQEQSDVASEWKERHRTRISGMEINKAENRTVEISLGFGNDAMVRELCFNNPHEVETFVRTFDKMRELMLERGSRLAAEHRVKPDRNASLLRTKERLDRHDGDQASKKSNSLFDKFGFGRVKEEPLLESVNLLVEIVSAADLPIADITSSDPYVCVQDGRLRWHKTGVVPKSLNPVWALSTGSYFLIETNLNDFFEIASHIEFIIKDYDTVGENDILGSTLVSKKDMLAGDGERIEYEIDTDKYSTKKGVVIGRKKSYLTLRFKEATENEINFLRSYEAKKQTGILSNLGLSSSVTGVFAEDSSLPPRVHPSTSWKRNERKTDDSFAPKYRLKPFPDPSRPQATKWLSRNEIEREAKKPSQDWIEAGSGNVGKLYLEILGCDDIPNLDYSVSGRKKSDPFVCIAFEDCVVNTDVINDCLAPRWMPWTRRAFVFNVMHPSSQIYIAVMDHEGIKSHHDKVGRCVVNPTNSRPNTVYTMRFSLMDSDEVDRKIHGKIMFRYRFESSTPRKYLLSTFQLRKDYYVSTNSRSDSHTMAYALTNDHDRYTLSLETIQKYLDEIFSYQLYLEDIYDALKVVILWRGHFPLTFSCFRKSYTFKAPLHSIISFTWGILLSIDFDRFVSFICFGFAWVLFATLENQRNNPNPWKRPRTYIDLLGMLLFDKSFVRHKIEEHENIDEIMAFDEHRADLMKFRKEAIEAMRIQNEQDEAKLLKERKEIDKQAHDKHVNLSIAPSRLFLAPFQEILVPVQKILLKACVYLRFVKSVVLWRDSVVAFWVATFALSLSAILFYVPWTFLLRWTFRILVFVFLGPWMKLVDIFFVENHFNMTHEERTAKVKGEMQAHYDYLMTDSKFKRLYKEHRMKTHDLEKYMFGQYGTRVPIFKEERFPSIPLAGGFAKPYDPSDEPTPNIVRRINGQVLIGKMIMQRQNPAKEFKDRKLSELSVPAVISMGSHEKEDEMAPLLDDDIEVEYSYGATEV